MRGGVSSSFTSRQPKVVGPRPHLALASQDPHNVLAHLGVLQVAPDGPGPIRAVLGYPVEAPLYPPVHVCGVESEAAIEDHEVATVVVALLGAAQLLSHLLTVTSAGSSGAARADA